MGNRYGRNQRRKHRERIAELDRQVEFERRYAQKCSSRAYIAEERLIEWSRRILKYLGPDSAFNLYLERLEVDPLMIKELKAGYPYRIAPQVPNEQILYGGTDMRVPQWVVDTAQDVVELFALWVEDYPEHFDRPGEFGRRRITEIVDRTPGSSNWCLALDPVTARDMRGTDHEAQFIDRCVRQILDDRHHHRKGKQ